MVMRGFGAGHFFHGNHAAFNLSAARVLELHGGVGNLKMFLENVVDLDQDAGAL